MKLLNETITSIGDLDEKAMEEAKFRLDTLFHPRGSLGKLEDIAIKLAGMTGKIYNTINKKVIIVMVADNGVVEEGISINPQEETVAVADNMLKGQMGVSVLARHAGAELKVVDIGIYREVDLPGLIHRKVIPGTKNMVKGPAMTREEAIKAIEAGIEITLDTIDNGADLLGTGEMGVGNTTTSSAIIYTYGNVPVREVVGRGAGLSDDGLKRKMKVIEKAVEINKPDPLDPLDVLRKVGGLDIAGMVGCYLGSASRRVPIVVDGLISGAAAIIAAKIKPEAKNYMIPSHLSDEPGSRIIREILGLQPMLYMDMRLGEGTGCALAFNLIEAATKVIKEMVTVTDAHLDYSNSYSYVKREG